MSRRPWRRARQFWGALRARVTDEEREEAASILGPGLLSLFDVMTEWDRRHGLSVCEALRRRGFEERELLQAALLHDCGKTVTTIRLWHRVAAVLLKALAPGWWNSGFWAAPGTWRYPFYVYREHPSLGAELALEAGCSESVARLIRFHEERRGAIPLGEQDWLLALERADLEV